jgi:hypothetical protein
LSNTNFLIGEERRFLGEEATENVGEEAKERLE